MKEFWKHFALLIVGLVFLIQNIAILVQYESLTEDALATRTMLIIINGAVLVGLSVSQDD